MLDIQPTLEDYKKSGAELLKALPNLNEKQLESGQKCLNLIYISLNDKDANLAVKMGFYDFFGRKIMAREFELINN